MQAGDRVSPSVCATTSGILWAAYVKEVTHHNDRAQLHIGYRKAKGEWTEVFSSQLSQLTLTPASFPLVLLPQRTRGVVLPSV